VTTPRILIIDDNPINVELAAFLLEADGFEVEASPDAEDAMSRIRGRRPDLLLMDIQLPGMNGLDLARRLKADPALRGVAIVAFTAYAMKGDEANMRAAGCDGYISKPIDVSTFAMQVRACLGPARSG